MTTTSLRNYVLPLNGRVDMITETCCNCGVLFGMAADYVGRLRETHRTFYCPNGHGQTYTGPTEAQLAKQRADRLEQQLASRDEDLRAERIQHAATKGKLTKTRRRAANGVCPCCHRSFVNVQRHVAGQHPDFDPADA